MSSLFAPILAVGTTVVESNVRLMDDQLLPDELACVRNAVAKRRAEFGTGRVCARRALAMLGLPEAPLTIGPNGAPAWPKGVVGSITHTSTYCAAVVKPCPPWRSVGIDAEDLQAMDEGVMNAITTETERRRLPQIPPDDRDAHATLLFSAKEAYYKLQHPLTGRFLEFRDVEVEVDWGNRVFRVRSVTTVPPELADVLGRFNVADGKILCAIELSPQDLPQP